MKEAKTENDGSENDGGENDGGESENEAGESENEAGESENNGGENKGDGGENENDGGEDDNGEGGGYVLAEESPKVIFMNADWDWHGNYVETVEDGKMGKKIGVRTLI